MIGPKGKMINSIQEDTGAEITIEDDGTIYIGATDGPSAEAARTAINSIANPHIPEVGERFLGTVVKTTTFGAFVSLLPGRDGLLHITQIRKLHGGARIENVDDVISVGDKIQVEIRDVDDRGKLSLVPVEVVEREAAGEDLGGGGTSTARVTAAGVSAGTATGATGAVTAPEAITTAPGSATAGRATHDRGYGAVAGRRRLDGCPHRPSGRPAGDHRVAARRALGGFRDLGGRRVAG